MRLHSTILIIFLKLLVINLQCWFFFYRITSLNLTILTFSLRILSLSHKSDHFSQNSDFHNSDLFFFRIAHLYPIVLTFYIELSYKLAILSLHLTILTFLFFRIEFTSHIWLFFRNSEFASTNLQMRFCISQFWPFFSEFWVYILQFFSLTFLDTWPDHMHMQNSEKKSQNCEIYSRNCKI